MQNLRWRQVAVVALLAVLLAQPMAASANFFGKSDPQKVHDTVEAGGKYAADASAAATDHAEGLLGRLMNLFWGTKNQAADTASDLTNEASKQHDGAKKDLQREYAARAGQAEEASQSVWQKVTGAVLGTKHQAGVTADQATAKARSAAGQAQETSKGFWQYVKDTFSLLYGTLFEYLNPVGGTTESHDGMVDVMQDVRMGDDPSGGGTLHSETDAASLEEELPPSRTAGGPGQADDGDQATWDADVIAEIVEMTGSAEDLARRATGAVAGTADTAKRAAGDAAASVSSAASSAAGSAADTAAAARDSAAAGAGAARDKAGEAAQTMYDKSGEAAQSVKEGARDVAASTMGYVSWAEQAATAAGDSSAQAYKDMMHNLGYGQDYITKSLGQGWKSAKHHAGDAWDTTKWGTTKAQKTAADSLASARDQAYRNLEDAQTATQQRWDQLAAQAEKAAASGDGTAVRQWDKAMAARDDLNKRLQEARASIEETYNTLSEKVKTAGRATKGAAKGAAEGGVAGAKAEL